jgi:heme A synthase
MGETVSPRSIGLHRFAVVTAVATLGLIVAGGLVTSTESGLSVPDWPLSDARIPSRVRFAPHRR